MNRFTVLFLSGLLFVVSTSFGTPAVAQISLVTLETRDGWKFQDFAHLKYEAPGKTDLWISLFGERYKGSSVDGLVQNSILPPTILNRTRTQLWGEPAIEMEWVADEGSGAGTRMGIDWFVIPKGARHGLRVRCGQTTEMKTTAERDEWLNEGRARCRKALVNNLFIDGSPARPGGMAAPVATATPTPSPAQTPSVRSTPARTEPSATTAFAPVPVVRPTTAVALRESAVWIFLPRGVDWDVSYDSNSDEISANLDGNRLARVVAWKPAHRTCSEAYAKQFNLGQSTATPRGVPSGMDTQWYANDAWYTGCYQTGQESTSSQEATVFWVPITNNRYPEYTNAMLQAVIDALALKAARVEMQNTYECVNAKGGSKFVENCSAELQRAVYDIGRLPSDYSETYYLRAKTLLLSYLAGDRSLSIRSEITAAVNRYLEMKPNGEYTEELRQVLRKVASTGGN